MYKVIVSGKILADVSVFAARAKVVGIDADMETLMVGAPTMIGGTLDLITFGDLAPIELPEAVRPKNAPYGPVRNSKKGKTKRW